MNSNITGAEYFLTHVLHLACSSNYITTCSIVQEEFYPIKYPAKRSGVFTFRGSFYHHITFFKYRPEKSSSNPDIPK